MEKNINEEYAKFNNFFDEQIEILSKNLNRAGKKESLTVLSGILPAIGEAYRKLNPDNSKINEYCLKKRIYETVEASKCKLGTNEMYSKVIQFFKKSNIRSDPPLTKPPKARHRKDIEQLSLFV